jgi:small subunit ribosomal protein S3
MRTPIDYGFAEAETTAGKIGIKCWICKGEEIEPKVSVREEKPAAETVPSPEVAATAVAE